MPYGTVQTLTAPSRGGDPDNFPGESSTFLGHISLYGPQVQALTSYLNALPMLKYQWGLLVQTNPTLPAALASAPVRPSPGDAGKVYTVKTDAFVAYMETLSTRQNQIGAFMDALSIISGATVFVADASRPVLTTTTAPPVRGDTASNFESKAVAFFNSVAAHSTNLTPLTAYYNTLLTASEDWDLITAAVDSTDDFGLLTESSDG